MKLLAVAAALFVVLGFLSATVEATTAKIEPQAEECFAEYLAPGGSMSVAFTVTHGGKNDIDAVLYKVQVDDEDLEDHPGHSRYRTSADYVQHDKPVASEIKTTKEIIQTWSSVSEGSHEHKLKDPKEGGKHQHKTKIVLCFNNHMARFTPKWVSFAFYKFETSLISEGLTPEEMNFVHAVHREAMAVHSVMTSSVQIRAEEEHHRDYVESTNYWILYGTLINGGMLIIMSFFQFWYLKRFLSVGGHTVIRNM